MFKLISINDVCKALKEVEDIERTGAGNEGEPLNSPTVQDYLSYVSDYVRNAEGGPNKRSITTLNNNDFPTRFNQDQYDLDRYVGGVNLENGKLILVTLIKKKRVDQFSKVKVV